MNATGGQCSLLDNMFPDSACQSRRVWLLNLVDQASTVIPERQLAKHGNACQESQLCMCEL